jgi:hypothetical protein
MQSIHTKNHDKANKILTYVEFLTRKVKYSFPNNKQFLKKIAFLATQPGTS